MAIGSGDTSCLRALYDRHAESAARLLRRLAPADLTDDLLQETWVAVWQSAGSYRGDSSVRSWILGVARRQVHNMVRRRRVETVQLDRSADVPDPSLPVEDQAVSSVGYSALLNAIRRLPAQDRAVVELGLVEGLPYAEIAAVLDVPVGTVKSRMSSARARLHAVLAGQGIAR